MSKKEYKVIRGYQRYKINKTGLVIDTETNELVDLLKDRNGQPLYRLQRDDNKQFKLVRVKHLLWLTFNLEAIQSLENERWKLIDVEGNTEYYVSNMGRLKRSGDVYREEILMLANSKNKGYKSFGYKGKSYPLHRLVASHFIGKIPNGYVVHHIDHNKHNNRADNLEICTQSQNMKYAVQAGQLTFDKATGSRLLTEQQATAIRAEYSNSKISIDDLAKKYGVGRTTTWKILKRKSYIV